MPENKPDNIKKFIEQAKPILDQFNKCVEDNHVDLCYPHFQPVINSGKLVLSIDYEWIKGLYHDEKEKPFIPINEIEATAQSVVKPEKKPFEYQNKLEWVPEIPGFVAYVLMCANGKMYKGHTGNFKQRMLQHFNGFGGATTKKMKPIYILHHDEFDSKKAAIAREAFFKSGYGFNWLKAGENLRTIKPSE